MSAWLYALPLADVPTASPVVDLAGVIPADQEATLSEQLRQARAAGLMEASVLTIDSSEGQDLFDYGIAVFNRWGLGNNESNKGLLLIVAVDDRQLRFHTGYGLEGALPDITTKRIIENNITPYFKQGDYAAGIISGMSAVQAVLAGEALPSDHAKPAGGQSSKGLGESSIMPWLIVIMFIGGFIRKIFGSLWTFLMLSGVSLVAVFMIMGLSLAALPFFLFILVFIAVISFGEPGGGGGGSSHSSGGWSSSGGGGSSWGGGGGRSGGGGAGGSW